MELEGSVAKGAAVEDDAIRGASGLRQRQSL